MNHVPNHELLSAYLDGELTAGEQAEVERLLADSPEARQLLDELRALSSTLQAMPHYTLGEDLSVRVLRMAERKMLTESLTSVEAAPSPTPSWRRRLWNPRIFVWPGVAVAVAVLIMILNPAAQQRRVVLQPKTLEHDATPRTAAGAADEGRTSREPPVLKAKGPAPHEELTRAAVSEASRRDAAEGALRESPPPERPQAPASSAFKGLGTAAGAKAKAEPAEPEQEGPVAVEARPAAPKAAVSQKMDEYDVASQAAEEAKPAEFPGKGGAYQGKSGYQGKSAFQGKAPPQGVVGFDQAGGGAPDYSFQLPSDQTRRRAGGRAAAGGVVVLEVSRQAAQNRMFDHVLAAQGIAWEDQSQVPGRHEAAKEGLADSVRDKPAEPAGQAAAQGGQKVLAGPLDRQVELVEGENVDAVWVEATEKQIEATLNALASQPDAFVPVAVLPAPGVRGREPWDRLNRVVRARSERQTVEPGPAEDGAKYSATDWPGLLRSLVPAQAGRADGPSPAAPPAAQSAAPPAGLQVKAVPGKADEAMREATQPADLSAGVPLARQQPLLAAQGQRRPATQAQKPGAVPAPAAQPPPTSSAANEPVGPRLEGLAQEEGQSRAMGQEVQRVVVAQEAQPSRGLAESGPSQPTYLVLFVLRMVDGPIPPAAASTADVEVRQEKAAQPPVTAEPAAAPAAEAAPPTKE